MPDPTAPVAAPDALADLQAEIRLWEGDGAPPVNLQVLRRAAEELAALQEIRKVATGALRCALSPQADRTAAEGFTEVALAYLTGHGGDYNAMLAADRK